MQGKNVAIGIVITVAVLAGAFLILKTGLPGLSGLPGKEEPVVEENLKTYASEELGVTFQYPEKYFLEERIINEAQRLHKVVVLIEDTPENRQLISGEVPSDGPTAITLDVFQNNLDNMSAMEFIQGTNNSNYKLGGGEIEEGNLSGQPAYHYTWDGLYRGESVVTANDKFVYMFSVTSLESTDEIRSDFYEILNTVVFN